jgi:hypothetical protein
MPKKLQIEQRQSAAFDLGRHCPHLDPAEVVDSLSVGLSQLVNLLMRRIHEDVERHLGIDTMIAPVSNHQEEEQARRARAEIEVYSTLVVNEEVVEGGFLNGSSAWFLDWLVGLLLGEEHEALLKKRLEFYRSPTAEDRRLKFLTVLQQAAPESARAPLVLFRLFPRAVRIVAAVAFGAAPRARELRDVQKSFLPAIVDCHECHGRILDNDEICQVCGNPVWEFEWLQAD